MLIGAIDVLPSLFACVTIPGAVQAELLDARAPAAVRRWAAAPPPWLGIASPPSPADAGLDHLDAGERAVIALALSLQPDFVLIDERAGTAAAHARGLEVMGTLGLLDRAARAGMIEISDAIAALRATNFHAPQKLFEALLARHRKRKRHERDFRAFRAAGKLPLPACGRCAHGAGGDRRCRRGGRARSNANTVL